MLLFFYNERVSLAKNGNVLITEHSQLKWNNEEPLFEFTKIVLGFFGFVHPANLINVD